jgi:hypothetical protein
MCSPVESVSHPLLPFLYQRNFWLIPAREISTKFPCASRTYTVSYFTSSFTYTTPVSPICYTRAPGDISIRSSSIPFLLDVSLIFGSLGRESSPIRSDNFLVGPEGPRWDPLRADRKIPVAEIAEKWKEMGYLV